MFQKMQDAVRLLNQEYRRFQERQTIYDWHTAGFQGRNNYCQTDPDATFMHVKDDHMRNARLKPGYNVQIAVDSEYIVSTEIFQDRNDVWIRVPFLKEMEKKMGYNLNKLHAKIQRNRTGIHLFEAKIA